jgi:peptide/nickel transport system ATP-binding protein
MNPDLLRVSDLQVSYSTDNGVARVLDRVDLSVGRGEVVGLVGESGCGKTTLARAILGVLPAPAAHVGSGTIEFDGENLLEKDATQMNEAVRGRTITFIPQDPYGSFNPLFKVGTQIRDLMKWKSPSREHDGSLRSLPALVKPYPRARKRSDKQRVIDLLTRVQIPKPESALGKLPHELSGGQRQRLMIAMALLPNPDLIIADEPTTALDVTIQAQILGLLRGLVKERGISVLFTTHDLGTAYEICDRVTVMYAGQEMETAPARSFFNEPSHPYTIRLLESLPRLNEAFTGIGGEIPGLIDPPGGCRFHPRCDHATNECRTTRPERRAVSVGHMVRCHHPRVNGGSEPRPATGRSS